ncbi:MAG: hypothetical protein H7Y32_11315, partial [Chloroflexales bacterium]|nr:hypothetical protein [Chloroflexales bacterium]
MRPLVALIALLLLAPLLAPVAPAARASDTAFNPLAAQGDVLTLRVARPGPI